MGTSRSRESEPLARYGRHLPEASGRATELGARRLWLATMRPAVRVAGVLTSAVVIGSLLRGSMDTDVSVATLLLYEAGVLVAAVVLLVGLRPPYEAVVTDLVVDLGDSRAMSLRRSESPVVLLRSSTRCGASLTARQ